jgi:hypothetical protein
VERYQESSPHRPAERTQILLPRKLTRHKSIIPLAALGHLRWLSLENLGSVKHIDPIGNLSQLEGLVLEGSMWRTWTVRTLAPVGSLRQLRYLSLPNLKSEDNTLSPLFTLRRLQAFRAAQWWSQDEVAELHRRNPRLAA